MNLTPQTPAVAVDANSFMRVPPPAAVIPDFNCATPNAIAGSNSGSVDALDTEMLTVSKACYRIKQLSWSITGTARAGAGGSVTIKRATRNADGTVCIGSTIGSVAVEPGGKWEFLQSGSAQMPDGATYVHVTTHQGGRRTAPLSIDF